MFCVCLCVRPQQQARAAFTDCQEGRGVLLCLSANPLPFSKTSTQKLQLCHARHSQQCQHQQTTSANLHTQQALRYKHYTTQDTHLHALQTAASEMWLIGYISTTAVPLPVLLSLIDGWWGLRAYTWTHSRTYGVSKGSRRKCQINGDS